VDPFVRALLALPVLDPAEERWLARRMRTGDRAARDTLITSGLRAVALRALMLGLRGEDLRDAVQSGTVGLIRAVDRFDPDQGARLATYAWRWIGAEMSRPARTETSLDDAGEPRVEECPTLDHDLLAGLSDIGGEVLRRRFGLGSEHAVPLPRRVVGEQLGLTVSQVRTIEGKAMRQLREGLAKVVDRAPLQGGADPP
jgi:RNA polymerase sigma factor (sigma-70 family)